MSVWTVAPVDEVPEDTLSGWAVFARLKHLGLVVYAGVFTTVKPFRARNVHESNIVDVAESAG